MSYPFFLLSTFKLQFYRSHRRSTYRYTGTYNLQTDSVSNLQDLHNGLRNGYGLSVLAVAVPSQYWYGSTMKLETPIRLCILDIEFCRPPDRIFQDRGCSDLAFDDDRAIRIGSLSFSERSLGSYSAGDSGDLAIIGSICAESLDSCHRNSPEHGDGGRRSNHTLITYNPWSA